MKVLTIGSERNLFKNGSEAQKRIKEYGQLFEELRIIVFASGDLGFQNIKLAENIFVYPTNHKLKILYLWQIYKIVKSIFGTFDVRWTSNVHILNWIITAQDPMSAGLAGWLLKIYFGIPLQLQIHADIFSPYFWKESLQNKIGVLLAKFLLPRADGIRVVSERIKNSILKSSQDFRSCDDHRIDILPIFVDVKKIQTAKVKTNLREKYPDYDFIILMASRLTREKNIGMAIEAMKKICQMSKVKCQMLLLIVGEGPERNALQLTIDRLQLTNNVVIENWSNDLTSYYKTADLFLLVSNHESYARTVVEAMAAGLPVIMTDVGLAGEFLVDDLDGRVVPVGDVKALTRAVSELIENPAKREEFKKNSLKLLEKWPAKKEYLKEYSDNILRLVKKNE